MLLKKIRVHILFLQFIFLASGVFAWDSDAIGRTSVYDIAVDSSGQNLTTFVKYGGIWQSDNGGLSWVASNSLFDDNLRAHGIEQHLVHSKSDTMSVRVFMYPSAEYFTYKTTNSGQTWDIISHPELSESHSISYVDKHHPNRWYSMGMHDIQISDDYGESWESHNISQYHWSRRSIKSDVFNDSILYSSGFYIFFPALDDYCEGLMKSIDGGITWDYLNPMIDFWGEFGLEQVEVYSFCQMSNGEFIVSVVPLQNGGDWLNNNFVIIDSEENVIGRFGAELPENHRSKVLIEDVEISGRIYSLCRDYSFLYISEDYGRTWNKCQSEGLPQSWQPCRDLFQNELSGDLYLSLGSTGIFKSTNNADLWEVIPGPPVGCSGKFSVFEESIFCYDHDGLDIWRKNDSDSFWQKIDIPVSQTGDTLIMPFNIFYCNDDTIVTSLRTFDKYNLYDGYNGQISHSYDNGNAWSTVFDNVPPPSHYPVTYKTNDHTRISFTRYSRDTVYVSENLGLSWNKIPIPPNNDALDYCGHDEVGFYIPTTNSIYYFNIDDETLIDLEYPGENLASPTLLTYNDTLYTQQWDGRFFIYDGESWIEKTRIPGSQQGGYTIIPGSPPTFVAALADSNGFWLSNNYGDSWEYLSFECEFSLQNHLLYEPQYDPYRHRVWIVAGIGIYWIDADELVASVSTGEPPELHPLEMEVLSSYPNPFNASTRITYNVTKPGDIKLRLYDITGRLVKECLKQYQTAGKHEYHLDASSLASGTYFMRLDMDYQAYVEKITLVK
jgi:Secretion system C-terminal sorting domain